MYQQSTKITDRKIEQFFSASTHIFPVDSQFEI